MKSVRILEYLGKEFVKEFTNIFINNNEYVGDTYYDNPYPDTIFDEKYDIKIEPLPKDLQMKSNNLPIDYSSTEFTKMVDKLKEYAKQIDNYDKAKDVFRVWQDVDGMVNDIRSHVEKYGANIAIDDDHDAAFFGYRCKKTGIKWRISNNRVFAYLENHGHTLDFLDVYCLNNGETTRLDKEKFSKIITETRKNTVWNDAEDMLNDIIEHAKKNEYQIEADAPQNTNHNAFVCKKTGKWWEISLDDFNKFDFCKKFNLPKTNWHTHLINHLNGKPYIEQPKDDIWTDISAMFENIKEHAKNNGRAIVSADQPMRLLMGWECQNTGKKWLVRVSRLRDFVKDLDEESTFNNALKQSDTVALCEILNGKDDKPVKSINPIFLLAATVLGGLVASIGQSEQQVRVETETNDIEPIEEVIQEQVMEE